MLRNEVSIQGKFRYQQAGWKFSFGTRLLLYLAFGLFLYFALMSKLVPQTFDIEPNTVSEKTIRAPAAIENFVATEKAKEEAAQKVGPVYRIVPTRSDQLADTIFSKLEQINADAEMTFDQKVSLYRSLFPSLMDDLVAGVVSKTRSSGAADDAIVSELNKVLAEQQYKLPEETYFKLPRMTKEDIQAMRPVALDIITKLTSEQIIDAEATRTKVTDLVNSSSLSKSVARELVQEIVRFAIVPNKFFDAKATDEARAQARENTKPVMIAKGDVLVEKGDIITPDMYQKFDKLGLLKQNASYGPDFGLVLLVGLALAMLHLFIRRSEQPIATNNVQLLMLIVIMIVTIVGMKVVGLGQNLSYPFIGFLAPTAMGTMLIALLLEAPLAMITAVLFAVVASAIFKSDSSQLFDFRYGLIVLVGAFTSIFTLERASQRSTILKAGIAVSLMSAVSILALLLLGNHFTLREFSFALSFGVASGLLTAVLVIGLMPFFESAFGILSPLKLVELSNPNHPLLRKLLTETPGTYHHSIMVGNLAEAAAESIGANGLLCRVGSHYHDIGKTKRPSYFIENQNHMENPHDSLSPMLSKSIIVAHARDGVEMLKEYKIPKQICDIAEQHHGTTLLKYFYHKAKQQAGENPEKPILEEDFRYPGPKAQSKEAAIVGIADCVEAAVRSMKGPTLEQIDQMVQKIIKGRLDDDQFNECDLTLKELDTIGKALKETLLGIFHSRIEYPSDEEIKQASEVKA